MFLNFLMVHKSYIPLYFLYGKKLISITISNFVIQYSPLLMSLNFLMVQKPYIPLYSLYGSITISKFKIQYSLINIPISLIKYYNSTLTIRNSKKTFVFTKL